MPVGQSKGLGYRMIDTFVARLPRLGVPGVHLGVGKRNQRAVAFYERAGFHVLKEFDWGFIFGMQLQ